MKAKGCGAHIGYAAAIFAALLLLGCNAEKRCARQMVRCGVVFTSDTQYIHDSIRIERTLHDTLLAWDSIIIGDTITIERDRMRVKVVKLPGERLWVQGECKDTVIRYVRQVVNNGAIRKEKYPWWHFAFTGFVGAVIGAIWAHQRKHPRKPW